MKYDYHICVDVVTASSCVRYLFKYISKGADMQQHELVVLQTKLNSNEVPVTSLRLKQRGALKRKASLRAPASAPPGRWLDQYGNIVSSCAPSIQRACRIQFQNSTQGDLFYLRLLLHHIPARSFEVLRTVDLTVHNSFHDAARARGLVTGDEEYFICMEEASIF